MRRFVLALLFGLLLPVSAQAASIGIYAGGASCLGTWGSCIIPTIDLELTGLEQPLKAIELSVEVPEALEGHLECVVTPGVTVTQNGDQFTIRLDECWSAGSDYSVPLFSLLYGAQTNQNICLEPADPSSVDPPAISYETCDGVMVPLELSAVVLSGLDIADGCLVVAAERVPVAGSTWGTLKTWY